MQEPNETPVTIDELTEWLENNEIDHPDYDLYFSKLKALDEQDENQDD
jgi:hypothetical protein